MRQLVTGLACAAAIAIGGATVRAQNVPITTLVHPTVTWFGPYAITANDTTRFNYSNLGPDAVLIEWAFTNALTGEMVCGNIGKPTMIGAGKGAIWDYSQHIDPVTGQEMPQCDGSQVVRIEPGETYFDKTGRHGLLAWIFVQHTQRGLRRAVDLPTVEVFNSMTPPDGTRPAGFGEIIAVLHANPSAPNGIILR